MSKCWVLIVGVAGLLVSGGCGGSSSSDASTSGVGGADLSQFQTTLPDGSVMQLEVFHNADGTWDGNYAVAAITGPYAFQTGAFEGSINGTSITAFCSNSDGTLFQLTGTANGETSLSLSRSDIPGTALTFTAVAPPRLSQRTTTTSFLLNTGAQSARATFSTTPYSSNSVMTEYRGTWNNLPVTFWSYSQGSASIILYVDSLCIETMNFTTYRLSDFPTITQKSAISQTTTYSNTIKAQVRFNGTVMVSP